ncbi:glycosyltransferase family 88 protein [Legionella oakridgensis]|uniref:glycosyltransferase family 88 protein n=1 Tax=Legionella oakridgensis TaxID=29423 RepID=UPI0003DE5049|nr:glycosyltransferase family 88 protein [Legionella oakridgensis]ETO93961.1 hypothetical protein LOR_88c24760 [Legionella oakridgensis RV-2-2007]
MPYHYKPHSHVKIWLSNNPSVFMNFENQTRLIEMREKNPRDVIHLVYDSTLLNAQALAELDEFCRENNITPVDASAESFKKQLRTADERSLYQFYQDEIYHLKEGGNLGVASDILRWLPPCYRLGTYTDLDVPLDTATLPDSISVNAPLLLNIGTLRLGKKETLITLNEYIAVVDEEAARPYIEQVHAGLVQKLTRYHSDYIEKTEESFNKDGFLSKVLLGYMKNRAESAYIQKSTEVFPHEPGISSRKLRAYINEVMTDKEKYLDFHKTSAEESHESVIKRLRQDLRSQLGIIKWLFFTKEYNEIKKVLSQNDDQFTASLMKKERSLYLKSIVICTTGPIEVANSLYDGYILSSDEVNSMVRPFTFSHYGLHHAFLSRNVIPLHENIFGMLRYLGADVGELNDSSWLEEGMTLQKSRQEKLLDHRKDLAEQLPSSLAVIKQDIEAHIKQLQQDSQGFFSFFGRARREAKIKALQQVLTCFLPEEKTFDIAQFKRVLADLQPVKEQVFAGFFFHRTQKLIERLEQLCYDAVVYRLAKDKKITTAVVETSTSLNSKVQDEISRRRLASSKHTDHHPSHTGSRPLGFFAPAPHPVTDEAFEPHQKLRL